MNIEEYREYCLSLGKDVEEKLPFTAFHYASGMLVFYVHGHMFSFFDCDNYSVITLKCQPERIEELKARHDCIGKPYNESPKYWIGINANTAPDELRGTDSKLIRDSKSQIQEAWVKCGIYGTAAIRRARAVCTAMCIGAMRSLRKTPMS